MFKKNEKEETKPQTEAKEKTKEKDEKKTSKGPSQREIVYKRVCEIVKSEKVVVKPNQAIQDCFTPEQLTKVHSLVVSDFKSGKAKLKDTPSNKEKLADDNKLKTYVVGLCSNWLRRDPFLNGDKPFNS